MQLFAVLTKDDLDGLLAQVLPLRIDLGGKRSIVLERAEQTTFLAGRGVRLSGEARLTWEMAGLAMPATVRAWQLLLLPSVQIQHGTWLLAFEPVLERLEIRNVPGFVDERITVAINEALIAQRGRLTWNFSKTLSWHRALPARVTPSGRFDLEPEAAEVIVTDRELRLAIMMATKIVSTAARAAIPARDDEPASLRGPISQPAGSRG